MRMILFFIAWVFLAFQVSAANIIDLYGARESQANFVVKQYGKKIGDIQAKFQQEMALLKPGEAFSQSLEQLVIEREQLKEQIKQEQGYLYVDFQTGVYPGDDNLYTTIEVVDKHDMSRMRFVDSQVGRDYSTVKYKDLISTMNDFINLEVNLMLTNKLDPKNTYCPVYHCMSGLSHPKLKPYLKLFSAGVVKDKKLVINTLNTDPDPQRRASAAFLLGYLNDPREIIALLTPHVTDPDVGVRNNVIRVIGSTMEKAELSNINIAPFVDLLDSPQVTDRNKSLLVLLTAANSSGMRPLIKKQTGARLISLLRLKQPNNHKVAYQILKKISGQDFGEKHATAWQKWLATA